MTPPPRIAEEVPEGRLPEDTRPVGYELELSISPSKERFEGRVAIDVALDRPRSVLWLHAKDLEVRGATVAAMAAAFRQVTEGGVARIDLPREIGPGPAKIELEFSGKFDPQLTALFRLEDAGRWYAFTQFEPLFGRQCFPSFDEPAFKTPFDITLTVDRDDEAIANTRAIEVVPLDGGKKRVRFARTEALPTYLIAFAVGPFDVVSGPDIPRSAVRDHAVPLRGIAVKGQGKRFAYALRETPRIVQALEGYFGLPYPFDKLDLIAVPDFGAGAMENAGAVTFRDWFVLLEEGGASARQRRAFAFIMAHELAHQWFGNLVTMPWWDDLWLNEAFATWMEERTVRAYDARSRAEVSSLEDVLASMEEDALVSARQVRQPIASINDIHSAFDGITYGKGAGVLSMFERWLGAEVFQRGITAHLTRFRRGSASAKDFLRSLSDAARKDVSGPFSTFLVQPGVPFVGAELRCEAGRAAEVRLTQQRYLPLGSKGERSQRWRIPVCIKAGSSRGGASESLCTLLEARTATVALAGGACPDWVLPNADGAGYYRFGLPGPMLRKLDPARNRALSTREKLAVAGSVNAALAGGQLSFEDAIAVLAPFAASGAKERELVSAPIEALRFAREHLLDRSGVAGLEAAARKMFAPTARRLGFGLPARVSMKGVLHVEDDDTRLLRRTVLEAVAVVARDPGVRREAARRGRAYLAGGAAHPDAADPELADLTVSIAVEDGDRALFEEVLARATKAEDPEQRRILLTAVAHAVDPVLAERARNLALEDGGPIRQSEIIRFMDAHTERPENRRPTFEWLKARYDQLAARVATEDLGYLPDLGARLCALKDAEELEAFFASRIEKLPGGPRSLAKVKEAIELCAAQVVAHKESARRYFMAK